jgi:hypothetical protein
MKKMNSFLLVFFVLFVQFFSEIEMRENATEYCQDRCNRTGSKNIFFLQFSLSVFGKNGDIEVPTTITEISV